MNSMARLGDAYEKGKALFEEIQASREHPQFNIDEAYGAREHGEHGRIGQGDNLEYMDYLLRQEHLQGKFKLIYVDPPFFSRSKYQASVRIKSEHLGESSLIKTSAYEDYQDADMDSYIAMVTARLLMMRELLADDGLIWVHLDWHAVHSVKLLMDEIFGETNFVNEIIWNYKSGGTGKKSFARKHDTLLLYSKTGNYGFNPLKEKSYNRGLKPYRFKDVEEFQDEIGWYTVVNMKDVWQIDMVGRTSQERTGYETQKPEKLMERIITSCSSEDDLCGDFFAGSGSFGAVCERLGRRWVMCDQGSLAISSEIARISHEIGDSGFIVERKDSREQVEASVTCSVQKNSNGVKTIRCTDYHIDRGLVRCNNQEEVQRFLDGDSLSLIKFWSIGQRQVGSAKQEFYREIRRTYDGHDELEILQEEGEILVVGYDLFGNRFSAGVVI